MLPDKELPFNSVEPIYILNWWTPNAWPHPTTPASELVTFHKASLLEAPKAPDLSLWVHHTCPLAEVFTEWILAIAHSSCPKCQLWWDILKLHKYEKLLNCNKLVPKQKHCPSNSLDALSEETDSRITLCQLLILAIQQGSRPGTKA